MKKDPVFTYQTRIEPAEKTAGALAKMAQHLSQVERCLFSDFAKGKAMVLLKSEYLQKHGITARQFNTIRTQLEGKVDSIIKLRDEHIAKSQLLIEKVIKKIAFLEKKQKKLLLIHQKKRQLARLKNKLENLLKDKKLNKVRLCFGSKKLFHAQFHLEENGYSSHEEWKEAWNKSRNDSFFNLGSKDETAGNQTCQAELCEDGTLTLTVRVPDALVGESGKYIVLEKIRFAYGHEAILAALASCQKRQQLKIKKDPSYAFYGQAISYRFKQKDNGHWYIYASTSLRAPPICTHKEKGAIGIDINADHIAVVETDFEGNSIHAESFSLNTYGKSSDQAEALIGDVVAKVVALAEDTQKPLVLEELDFSKKKESLKENNNASYARMLSSFAYGKIIHMIQSRGCRHGVEVLSVNPAFTSVIGRIKYALRYGLSVHQSAALCIARRGLRFSEKIPSRLDRIPDGKGDYVALTPPVRIRNKHKWSDWRKISKKLSAELAAHFWAKKKESICKAVLKTA